MRKAAIDVEIELDTPRALERLRGLIDALGTVADEGHLSPLRNALAVCDRRWSGQSDPELAAFGAELDRGIRQPDWR